MPFEGYTVTQAYELLCNKKKEVELLLKDVSKLNERLNKAGIKPLKSETLYYLKCDIESKIRELESGIIKLAHLAFKTDSENGTDKPTF